MQNIEYAFNIFLGVLCIVIGGFIAIPALRRFIRNISLVRKGRVAQGHYLSASRATYITEGNRRIEFSTWRKRAKAEREIEVIYNPRNPQQAEVYSAQALWIVPIDHFCQVIIGCIIADALFHQVNSLLAVGLGLICAIALWFVSRCLLILLVLIYIKSPRLQKAALFPDLKLDKIRQKPQRTS